MGGTLGLGVVHLAWILDVVHVAVGTVHASGVLHVEVTLPGQDQV